MIKSETPNILILLLCSAMGPYVFPQLGLRVEHILMYGLLIIFALKTQLGIFLPKDRPLLTLYVLFVSLFLVTVLVTVGSGHSPPLRKVVADSENLIQPIILIVLTFYCIKKLQLSELFGVLETVIRTIIIILAINALISVSSIFFGPWVLDYINVGGEYEGGFRSVAAAAAEHGRYSGIFNQPFEAGVAYGSCLLLIMTLKFLKREGSPVKTSYSFLNFGLVFIFLGGLLSVSKVFFPLAIFVAICFLILNNGRRLKITFSRKYFLRTASFFVLAIALIIYLFDYWSGVDFLLRLARLFEDDVDIVELFTAGRFSTSETGMSVVEDRLQNADLILGYGLGSIQVPDSAYLEILYFGGVLGLLNYFLILLTLLFFSIRGVRYHPVVARYLFSLTLFIALSSVGAPVFGINRANFFVIIPLVITIRILSLAQKQWIMTVRPLTKGARIPAAPL